jgi:glycosyltransferase involved in cell wall biosynthesis
MVEGLRAAGVPAIAVDITAGLRQPVDLPPPADPGQARPGPGTLIVCVNAPLTGMALLAIGRQVASGKRVIGLWNWELPEVPPEWRLGVSLVHEIWVSSAFTAGAIRPIAGNKPLHVVDYPINLHPPSPRTERRPGTPFTVLCMFDAASSVTRKNPEGAIEAFRRAFGTDPSARLVLKAQRLAVAPDQKARLEALAAAHNIEILDATLDDAELDALYDRADVLLSLHRAEGYGLTLAEAMRRGLPVVATDWSGNVDFVSEAVGIPVPVTLVPARDPQRTYDHPRMRWAEPDLDFAAVALRRLRDDAALAARLGAAGAAFAASRWSAAAWHARLPASARPSTGVQP